MLFEDCNKCIWAKEQEECPRGKRHLKKYPNAKDCLAFHSKTAKKYLATIEISAENEDEARSYLLDTCRFEGAEAFDIEEIT